MIRQVDGSMVKKTRPPVWIIADLAECRAKWDNVMGSATWEETDKDINVDEGGNF